MRKWTTGWMILALVALGACDANEEGSDSEAGESAGEESAIDESVVEEIGAGLEPGGYELNISGDVEQLGEYTEGDGPYSVGPANDGTNHEGPYKLRVRAETERDGEEHMAYALVVLPEEAEPGTYELQTFDKADDDEAHAMFRATAQEWAFSRDISGEVTVGEIGDEVTVAFEFEVNDTDGEGVEVDGRVYKIPFEYETGVRAEGIVGGEEKELRSGSTYHDEDDQEYQVRIGSLSDFFSFTLPEDLDADEYELVVDADGDDQIEVNSDPSFEDLDGHVEIERDGEFAHGEFEMKASGEEGDYDLTGHFEYVSVQD